MLISIIIPVYNEEKHINKCIKSAVCQEYNNIEIIIINDGSKDNSEAIIKKWLEKDSRIKYFTQENQGVAIARNKGITNANGDYIFFLDADDYLEQDAILKLVSHAKQTKADIVIGNYYEKIGHELIKRPSIKNKLFNKKDLALTKTKLEMFVINGRHMSMAGNKLYCQNFIKKHQFFFKSGVVAEDRLFNLMCYVNNPIIQLVDEFTYIYNKLDDSRSRSFNSNFYNESISLLNNFYKYLREKSKLEENYELFQLITIYDINKIINRTFLHSNKKISMTNYMVKKLKNNSLIYKTLSNVFDNNKFKNINGSFYRMRLVSYFLIKIPFLIVIYKILGKFLREIKHRL